MNVTDTMTKKRIKEFEPEALQTFQDVLDMNCDPKFLESTAKLVKDKMLKTGSCTLIPPQNSPALCRHGVGLLQKHRNVQDIYFPLIRNVFSDIPNPGDPVLFCMIAHDPVGMLFEWDHFYDRWRRDDITIPDTTREDMITIDGQLRRQLMVIRKNRAREDAAEAKRAKSEGV